MGIRACPAAPDARRDPVAHDGQAARFKGLMPQFSGQLGVRDAAFAHEQIALPFGARNARGNQAAGVQGFK
jgi:hypothetical protein